MVHGAGCRVEIAGCRVQGAGFRVQNAGCRVQGAGRRAQGAGCRVQAGCRLQASGCRVQGAGCRVQGAGCRVQGGGLVEAHALRGEGEELLRRERHRDVRSDPPLRFRCWVLVSEIGFRVSLIGFRVWARASSRRLLRYPPAFSEIGFRVSETQFGFR